MSSLDMQDRAKPWSYEAYRRAWAAKKAAPDDRVITPAIDVAKHPLHPRYYHDGQGGVILLAELGQWKIDLPTAHHRFECLEAARERAENDPCPTLELCGRLLGEPMIGTAPYYERVIESLVGAIDQAEAGRA